MASSTFTERCQGCSHCGLISERAKTSSGQASHCFTPDLQIQRHARSPAENHAYCRQSEERSSHLPVLVDLSPNCLSHWSHGKRGGSGITQTHGGGHHQVSAAGTLAYGRSHAIKPIGKKTEMSRSVGSCTGGLDCLLRADSRQIMCTCKP